MHDVFISYSSKDIDITEQVRQILETNGISCWIAPRNIPSGSSYAAEIPAAIRGCTVFLLIGSLHAEASPWIRKELERAIIERKKIIPLMVEDVAFQDEFDFLLSLHQRYAAYEKTSETMETLVKDIRTILGMDTPAKTQKALAMPRYDGYYTAPGANGNNSYYRFYPNGKVISSYTSVPHTHAKKWLDESKDRGSNFSEENGTLWLNEIWSNKDTYRAKLNINGDKMTMDGHNRSSNKHIVKECTFVAFDDLFSPAVAQLPSPRFDGIYMGPAVRRGISTFHNYYRFYPNGLVVSSYSAATPDKAKTWLDESHYDGSRYAEENGALWMTEMLSSGCTYHAKLTVDSHRLLMEGYNSYSKKDITRDCVFIPFDGIK